jgi:hypothetical protein
MLRVICTHSLRLLGTVSPRSAPVSAELGAARRRVTRYSEIAIW